MKSAFKWLFTAIFYRAGDNSHQCKRVILRDSGKKHHGDRILSCTNGNCGW